MCVLPYRDDNPTIQTPVVTIGVIVLTSLVWIVVQGAGNDPALGRSVCELGAIPGELLRRVPAGTTIPIGPRLACQVTDTPHWYTVVSSIFLHGGWLHLIGNMWFLWIFGNNVEDSMGRGRFVVFYLACGVLAALAQIFASPSSPVPMVGASGAISGVMGAYVVLYPRVRVHLVLWLGFWITTVAVPAYLMLFYWAFLQLLGSLPSLGQSTAQGGVAFLAHLGGFAAGAALIRGFVRPELLEAHRRHVLAVSAGAPWQRHPWT